MQTQQVLDDSAADTSVFIAYVVLAAGVEMPPKPAPSLKEFGLQVSRSQVKVTDQHLSALVLIRDILAGFLLQ